MPALRRRLRRLVSGLGVAYSAPRGSHPWTGQRVPDVDLGETRLDERMRHGGFTVLDRTGDFDGDDRAVVVRPSFDLPGWPPIVLIRPDGYAAWAGEDSEGARAALDRWCPSRAAATPAHPVT